jgi:hypothetical protein
VQQLASAAAGRPIVLAVDAASIPAAAAPAQTDAPPASNDAPASEADSVERLKHEFDAHEIATRT